MDFWGVFVATFEELAKEIGECTSVERPAGHSNFLLVCEHASRSIPSSLGNLGLPQNVLSSHIAWDPGALATAMLMSEMLDATLIYQSFSRLIYDCNRPPEATTAIPDRSEVYDIPGNKNLTSEDRTARAKLLYEPFHRSVAQLIAQRRALRKQTILITMHSFTPVFHGKARSVELGILHDRDTRLADGMLAAAETHPVYVTKRNEPYGPEDGVTHTLQLHGIQNDIMNVMIELRNDLIADQAGQEKAASHLVKLLGSARIRPINSDRRDFGHRAADASSVS